MRDDCREAAAGVVAATAEDWLTDVAACAEDAAAFVGPEDAA